MNRKAQLLVMLCIVTGVAGCRKSAAVTEAPKEYKERMSYAIGLNIGESLKRDSIDVAMDLLLQGVKDGVGDTSHRLMTAQEVAAVKKEFDQNMAARQAAKRVALAEKNKAEGDAFLEANRKHEGVVVLPDGLQYIVLREGTGKTPRADQTVIANYIGMTIDGAQFDNTYLKGKPATIPIRSVIPGWAEALQKMKVGSKWRIYIPPQLAYGEQGTRGGAGPNVTLIFEVELLGIQK